MSVEEGEDPVNTRHHVVEPYYRREHFDFWSRYRDPFYAVTVHLDITRLKSFVEERGASLYLSLSYFTTRAMRAIEDFRYRLRDGRVVLYEELHPGVTLPAPEGRFTFAHLEYHPDFATFHERARRIVEAASREVDLSQVEHPNQIYFSALPKVPFTSITHATDEPTDTVPRVTFGKFERRDGRLRVPVGIQVNHIFIDGAALGEWVEATQGWFETPEG